MTVKDNKLYVGNSTHYNAFVDGYAIGNLTLAYLAAYSDYSDATYVATAGYITVEVTDPPIGLELEAALDIIIVTIPLIFTVAVIGVILKMFKEVSK